MSSGRYTLRDLVEEAKKRVVVLFICVFGISYLMSLTSSSVWINLPFATCLILLFRYLSLDFDIKRKAVMHTNDQRDTIDNQAQIQRRSSVELQTLFPKKLEKIDWRKKVNSPPVEAAIEKFTRHIISEWVTDLWYSRITPDKEGPEELISLVNSVLGEVASRARDVNLINLLTRDIINLICEHLELYRLCQSQIGKEQFLNLTPDQRDSELKSALESEKKLHPALFSAASEHKVLHDLTSGLLSITLRPEDLSCSFFRYTARELLACVVLRPIINLANPRFLNERIEGLVIMLANRAALKRAVAQENLSGPPPMPSADQLYAAMDKSSPGLELVRLRMDQPKSSPPTQVAKDAPKNSLVSHKSVPSDSKTNSKNVEPRESEAQWTHLLDQMSKQKSKVLAPEHFENVWSKGRDYKQKEYQIISSGANSNNFVRATNSITSTINTRALNRGMMPHQERKIPAIYEESESSDTSEEDEDEIRNSENENGNESESNSVMGLDTPGIRVWESKSKNRGNATVASSRIHHPLESSEIQKKKRNKKSSSRKLRKKRSRSFVPNSWGEAERSSLLLDGHDIQNSPQSYLSFAGEYLDYAEGENGLGRAFSGMGASSSLSSFSSSISSYSSSPGYSANNVLADSFIKLKSEVLAANIVKSGSGMFAVYSVAVTDGNGHSWSIKRRFRHFEELHRRLKEFPEYNLSLPPKHFLSSGLEVPVVRERCKLLDTYLKKLLQIPTISGSIEVWDFLSVDSQTYIFSDSLSTIQTLSVNLDDKTCDRKNPTYSSAEASNLTGNLFSIAHTSITNKEDTAPLNQPYHHAGGGLRLRKAHDTYKNSSSTYRENGGSDSESPVQTDFSFSIKSEKSKKHVSVGTEHVNYTSQIDDDDDTINSQEWTPPNLTVPLLNLVDVIFQVQDGGWIRRQAFWVAKQILQLGMGDAFDDWLIDKIQLLRKGPVIASGIQRIEQILWPDGIFLTKHPKRRPPAQASTQNGQNNPSNQTTLTPEQQREAARRAKFVHELMIEKAPTALVSLVGRKEYERCAQDVYMFLQSPVCLKQLAYELLELLVLVTFPELDGVVRQFHEQK
ncbi:Sorting nexin-13 [Rhynchospora pubera]|uniref:Sorting nexin-13 n=1 Tax=Rhynchospora pubera TaxID=906938 RepID=A0AAV8C4P8_9POAL|nr:Sorting nexin-13 [Rhynchospora pubera]